MGAVQPFRRASVIFGLINAARQIPDPHARHAAMGEIPDYESHGKRKTKHHPVKAYRTAQRAALKARNVARNRKAHQ